MDAIGNYMNKPYTINISENKTGSSSLLRAFDICYWNFNNESAMSKEQEHDLDKLAKFFFLKKDFKKMIEIASKYKNIKDYPWNIHQIPEILFENFKDSNFILVERDEESWYKSLYNWCFSVPTNLVKEENKKQFHEFIRKNIEYFKENNLGIDIHDKSEIIKNYLKRNEELKKIFSKSNKFFTLKFEHDINWISIKKIVNFTEQELKEKIINYYEDNADLYKKYKPDNYFTNLIINKEDPIDKWLFPHLKKNKDKKHHIIDGISVFEREY
jgi:hypothetical protein